MEWLAENWFWVLVGILFIVMHIFGHGSHGGHAGGHRSSDTKDKSDRESGSRDQPPGHRH